MISTTFFDTPLGPMLALAENDALTGLYFVGQHYYPGAANDWREEAQARPFSALRQQLDQYFAGTRRTFELPLNPGGRRGTLFQRAIWRAIAAVQFGDTTTYSALAAHGGRPSAARAAGAATGRNPLSLVVPCHRIVGSSGALTGYAGGLERKRALLAFERAIAAGEACTISRFIGLAVPGAAISASHGAQAELRWSR